MPTPSSFRKLNLLSNGASKNFWDALRLELTSFLLVIISMELHIFRWCSSMFVDFRRLRRVSATFADFNRLSKILLNVRRFSKISMSLHGFKVFSSNRMPTPSSFRKLQLLSSGATKSFWDSLWLELWPLFVISSSSTPCVTHFTTFGSFVFTPHPQGGGRGGGTLSHLNRPSTT